MATQAKALGSTLVPRVAQGEDRVPGPLRSRPSSPSASHALRCHRSQGLRGRSVPSTPRQPTPPVHRGSPTAATPSQTLLTLFKTLLTLLQKGLTSRGSSLGDRGLGGLDALEPLWECLHPCHIPRRDDPFVSHS